MMETVPGPSYYQHHDPYEVQRKGGNKSDVDAAYSRLNILEKLPLFDPVSTITFTSIQFIIMHDNLNTSRSELFRNRS
jgi:hypothetical protein